MGSTGEVRREGVIVQAEIAERGRKGRWSGPSRLWIGWGETVTEGVVASLRGLGGQKTWNVPAERQAEYENSNSKTKKGKAVTGTHLNHGVRLHVQRRTRGN